MKNKGNSNITEQQMLMLHELNSRFSKKASLLKAISIVLLSIFMIFFLYIIVNFKMASPKMQETTQISTSANENKVQISIINDYLKLIQESNVEETYKFYTENLTRFYLEENISRNEVINEEKTYLKKNPNTVLEFDPNTIHLVKNKNSENIAYVNATYYKNKGIKPIDILFEIKLNSENKIFYVRNYKAANSNRIVLDSSDKIYKIKEPHLSIEHKYLDTIKE